MTPPFRGGSRSSRAEVCRRTEAAAALLSQGVPRTAAVSELADRFAVDRRTARRYVAAAAANIAEEVGAADLAGMLAESVERLRRLSWAAENAGNLSAAVGAEKAAAVTVAALLRSDAMASGRTLAMIEQGPPSEAQQKRYRRSIRAPDPAGDDGSEPGPQTLPF